MDEKTQKKRNVKDEILERMAVKELRNLIPELKNEVSYTISDMKDVYRDYCSFMMQTEAMRGEKFKKMSEAYKDILNRLSNYAGKLGKSEQINDKDLCNELLIDFLDIHSKFESLLFVNLSKAKYFVPLKDEIKSQLRSNEFVFEQVFGLSFFYAQNRRKVFDYQKSYVNCKEVENYEGSNDGTPLPEGYAASCLHKGIWQFDTTKNRYVMLTKEMVVIDREEKYNDILIEENTSERNKG